MKLTLTALALASALSGCVSFPDAERVRRCEADLARERDQRISSAECIQPHVPADAGKPVNKGTVSIPYGYFGEGL